MNYLAGVLGILLILCGLTAWGYKEDAQSWHNKYDERVSGEKTAVEQAKIDAANQEAKDTAALKLQSSQAILSAQAGQKQAQTALQAYQMKLAEASKDSDLPHKCAGVPIAPDLIP